jgi:hypothetical protein
VLLLLQHMALSSALAMIMGAVCHRRGFPVVDGGVKIASLVVVVPHHAAVEGSSTTVLPSG